LGTTLDHFTHHARDYGGRASKRDSSDIRHHTLFALCSLRGAIAALTGHYYVRRVPISRQLELHGFSFPTRSLGVTHLLFLELLLLHNCVLYLIELHWNYRSACQRTSATILLVTLLLASFNLASQPKAIPWHQSIYNYQSPSRDLFTHNSTWTDHK
jgi:hypothetical protein